LNDLAIVSTEGSVKLRCPWRRGRPAAGQKDPVELYCSLVLGWELSCVG